MKFGDMVVWLIWDCAILLTLNTNTNPTSASIFLERNGNLTVRTAAITCSIDLDRVLKSRALKIKSKTQNKFPGTRADTRKLKDRRDSLAFSDSRVDTQKFPRLDTPLIWMHASEDRPSPETPISLN